MSNQLRCVIEDGYSRSAYIKERNQCYPEVRFTYRPVLPADRTTIFNAIEKSKSGAAEEWIAARAIEKYVESWDVVDGEGQPYPIKADHALKLDSHLYQRIFHITMGSGETDHDPAWSVGEKTKANSELDAVLGPQSRQINEAADIKN